MASTASESTADFPRGGRVGLRQDHSVGPAGTRIEVLEPAGHPSGGSHTASASESVRGGIYRVRRGADDSDGGVSGPGQGSALLLILGGGAGPSVQAGGRPAPGHAADGPPFSCRADRSGWRAPLVPAAAAGGYLVDVSCVGILVTATGVEFSCHGLLVSDLLRAG